MLFFFFKQKTADEMRISDWSSDVCSSDLYGSLSGVKALNDTTASMILTIISAPSAAMPRVIVMRPPVPRDRSWSLRRRISASALCVSIPLLLASADLHRSEEHTSELQSLMRISYAVFCLKKKNIKHKNNTLNITN